MLMNHDRFGRALLLILLGLVLLGPSLTSRAEAQTSGPLSQYRNNVHQMFIVARFISSINGTQYQADVVQTVTAVAVHSEPGQTFWVVEKDHVDPQLFYRERNVPSGTPITFSFFVDTLDITALAQGGQGDPISVFKFTDTYAVLQDLRKRTIPDVVIATDPQANEAAVIALPQGGGVGQPPATFSEAPTKILQVPANSPLFFIAFTQQDSEFSHGAPVFVPRKGQWSLAGIRVAHGRSTQPNQSAAAKLPPLDQLIAP